MSNTHTYIHLHTRQQQRRQSLPKFILMLLQFLSYQSFDIYIASNHYSHHSHSCSTNDLVEECVDMNIEGKRRSQTREEGEMRGEITDVNIYRITKT